MKILYAVSSLSGGGAEVFTTQLACAMSKRAGNEVHFATYAGAIDRKGLALKAELEQAGVILHSSNVRNNLVKFGLPFYFARLIGAVHPDVVHSHLDHTDLLVALAKKLIPHKNILFLRTIHNVVNAEKTFSAPVMKWLFSQFDYNIGCSDFVKANYVYPEKRSDIIVINNGIEIKDADSHKNLRKELNIGQDELVFLQIGSLKKRVGLFPKAHDIVFRAFKSIPDLKCKVLFLGDNANIANDYDRELYNDPRFIFLGLKDDIYPYLGTADLLLAPSRFEGLPISAIEAACQGLPMLCSDIAGFKDFQGSSTVRCKTDSMESFREKLIYCIDHMNTLRQEGKLNRDGYRNKFDIDKVLDRYMAYYSK